MDRTADRAAATNPLASPRDAETVGRTSRRTSGWKEGGLNVEEEEESEEEREAPPSNEEGLVKVDSGKGKGKGKEKENATVKPEEAGGSA